MLFNLRMRSLKCRFIGCLTMRITFIFLISSALSCLAPAQEPRGTQPTGGWAEVDITPPLGIALGGRGGPDTLATKVLDRLFAQVLLLRDRDGHGLVLVSLDLVGLPRELSDRMRTDIVQELGVEWNLVVLNASHTHSGPYMIRSLMAGVDAPPPVETEYFKALQENILVATRLAAKKAKPVKVETFEGTSRLAINRRGKNKQGRAGIIPDPKGPFDPKVWVLRVTPLNGDDPAVVFSYACHPVIAYGFAYSAISADFPGVTRRSLREALGPKAHVQFVQGFAGDVRPRVVADLENNRFRTPKPDDLQQAGEELAAAVKGALKETGQVIELNIA